MANLLELIFTRDNMQRLMDQNPDKILVRSIIEEAVLDNGKKAGVVKVYADAIRKGEPEPIVTVEGCPMPPCKQDDGAGVN